MISGELNQATHEP